MWSSLLSHAVVAAVFYALGYTIMQRRHEAYRAYNKSILAGLQMVNNLPKAEVPAPAIDGPSVPRPGGFPRPLGVSDAPTPETTAAYYCICGATFASYNKALEHHKTGGITHTLSSEPWPK
jgi:hypothetical protein